MNFIQKLKTKEGILDKIELILASTYLVVGKLLEVFAGKGIAILASTILMLVFIILIIIFFRQHIYGKEKTLLTVLSIYYKSMAYTTVIFALGNLPGKYSLAVVTMASLFVYAILSCFNGKQYSQVLNAYLYLLLISFAGVSLYL